MLGVWCVVYGSLERHMSEGEMLKPQTDKADDENIPRTGKLFRTSGLPVLLIVSVIVNMTLNGIKLTTPIMIMESYKNMPAAVATRLSIILIVFSVLGVFLANVIREKITRNEVKAIIGLLAISIPVIAVAYFVGKLHYLTILIFLAGAVTFLQGTLPLSNSFAAARFTVYGRGGTVSGLLNAMAAMGILFASYVFPAMSETISWNYIALTWCGLGVAGIVFSLIMLRRWTEFIEMDHIFN